MSEEEAVDLQNQLQEFSHQDDPIPALVWEQWPGEPDDWYANFLVYLALGSGRSIDRAWKITSVKNQKTDAAVSGEEVDIIVPGKASSTWWGTASKWKWEQRAQRYDVYTLSQLVPQTVQLIFATIGEFAKVTMEQLQSRDIRPETWPELRQAVETLASYISPEIIQATVQHATHNPGITRAELGDGRDDE